MGFNSGAGVLRGCRPCFLKKRGFTLVEILMTLGIFAVTTVSLISLYVAIAAINESARNMTQAMADGRAVMEAIRDTSTKGLSAVTGTNWTTWATANSLTSLNNETVTVTYANSAADPLDVSLTVQWSERDRTRSAVLTTLVTRR